MPCTVSEPEPQCLISGFNNYSLTIRGQCLIRKKEKRILIISTCTLCTLNSSFNSLLDNGGILRMYTCTLSHTA